MNKALGIDIGGTKISYALVDNNGEIKSEIKKVATPRTKEEIIKVLKDAILEYENEIEFVAIATAGAVNNENTKVIGSTANLPSGYKDIDFQSLSSKKVFIENDANAAAWAEYRIGASRNCKNSVMLTLGTGVGGGIILNGKLLKGKSGAAGEMHFMMSRKQERKCTCGAYDCFEAYASGNGLKQTAIEIFEDETITTYDVIEKATKNDKKAILTLKTWQNDIALGVLGLNNIFDADCFVLSGSMEKFVDAEEIENFVNSKTVTTPTKIYHAKAGNYAGMIGAVVLANELL
ncbi:MAG: ROK family protein [Candidatus Gastranaerophilales bacterium]|nr:ROK family protein [Candidatus Gastranaerophilales bacterium]